MIRILLASTAAAALLLLEGCSSAKRVTPSVPGITPPAGMRAVDGKLLNQIARLEKSMPRAGSEGFVVPSESQKQTFFKIATDLRTGNLQEALPAAIDNQFELLWYTDQHDDNAVDLVLREADPSRRGWGLYIFRADSQSSVIIEAPHPIFDEGTPDVAGDVFRGVHARALLIAGAHRDANRDGSADASAQPQTIFQAIHEAELQQAVYSTGAAFVLQIHGFSAAKHPAYPQVILSYEHGGSINPAELVKGNYLVGKIAAALEAQGIRTGTCGAGQWRDLCGSKNIQAALMTQGIFIHIELDESARSNDRKLIEALRAALTN